MVVELASSHRTSKAHSDEMEAIHRATLKVFEVKWLISATIVSCVVRQKSEHVGW